MSVLLKNLANQIRSAGADPNLIADVLVKAADEIDQIDARISPLVQPVGSSSQGGFVQNQAGSLSIGSLDVQSLSRQFDFYDIPEVQYIGSAATAIQPTGTIIRIVNTTAGSLTMAATPTVYAGSQDGEFVEIQNTGTQNFVFQDGGTLAGSGLALSLPTVTVPPDTVLQLRWSQSASTWIQLASIPTPIPSSSLNIGIISIGPNGTMTEDGITWTPNTGTGTLSWSSGTVTYQGIKHAISAGSTNVNGQVVYWQLGNPNVFSTAGLPLVLGVNDFIVAQNSAGRYNAAINLVRSDGARLIILGDTIFITNNAGTIVADFGIGGTFGGSSANDHGTVQLSTNAGTVSVALFGDAGTVVLGTSGQLLMQNQQAISATAGLHGSVPNQVAGYLLWTLGVNTIKIPFFNN